MALTGQIYFLILTGRQQTLHTVLSYVPPAGRGPQNFIPLFINIYKHTCVCVCLHMCVQLPAEAREGVRFPGTGVIGG